ncbi:unnamed protein product [marine sediment metagenome]|uniref:Uncharacterized protein n=1 Tax=marine sediment metagenome TaxID=412755 RepID=X1PC96_9ZZZZ
MPIGKKDESSGEVTFTWITKESIGYIQGVVSQSIPDLEWNDSKDFAWEALIENEYVIYSITLVSKRDQQSRIDIMVAEEPGPVLSGILQEFVLFDTVKERFLTEEDLTFDYFNL